MLLSVKNVKVHYGKVEALKGISVDVEEGQIVTLIGANGAGKTTLLRAISGLRHPTSGEIWMGGRRIDNCSPPDIVRMGVAQVPEGRRIFPFMSVIDNLLMGAYTCTDKRRMEENLEMVYSHFPMLKERRGQSAGTLSGGEQQMLAIARALMATPRLLLLDEPSLGLSPLMVREIAKIIQDINATGRSIVLVEQNAAMALRLAQKGYVIQTGNIIMEGPGQDLLDNDKVKEAYLGG